MTRLRRPGEAAAATLWCGDNAALLLFNDSTWPWPSSSFGLEPPFRRCSGVLLCDGDRPCCREADDRVLLGIAEVALAAATREALRSFR